MRPPIALVATIFVFLLIIDAKSQTVRELTAQERAVTVTIVASDKYDGEAKRGFKYNENITVLITITNSTPETFYAAVSSHWDQNRPELLKEGTLVPYRADVSEGLKRMENEECRAFRNLSVEIEPDETERIDHFILNEWYETLEPGTYQLKLRRAFASCRGAMTESDVIEFYVLP